MWSNWTSRALWVGMLNGSVTLENRMSVPYKVQHDPAVSLGEMKTYIHIKVHV